MKFGSCKVCEHLKRENEYLKTLIDRLLVKQNLAPITQNPPKEEKEEDEFEKIIAEGGQVFGE